MYAFFQRLIKQAPKADISLYGDCKSYIAASSTYRLSNGLILSIGKYKPNSKDKKNQTEVILFDVHAKTKIAEAILPENYTVFSNLFDNKLLLCSEDNKHIDVFDCNTLKIVGSVAGNFNDYDRWLSLGDQRFVSVEHPHYGNKNAPFRLIIQDLATKTFNQPASLPLPINEQDAVCMGDRSYINVDHLSQLTNGQFACLVRGHNTGYFSVILFDRTPGAEYEFQIAGVIKPAQESWGLNDSSTPKVKYVGLPNGNILTYHLSGQDFQLWHGAECIDTWSWGKNVKCDDKVFRQGFWTYQVVPLPDSENLLINSRVKLFIFNTKSHEIQAVDLGKFEPEDVYMCPDGKAIVRAQEIRDTFAVNNTLLLVDFSKILPKNAHNKIANDVDSSNQTFTSATCRM